MYTYWIFFIRVQLLYDAVFFSAVKQSESAVCTHTPSLRSPHPTLSVTREDQAELLVLNGTFPLALYVTHGDFTLTFHLHALEKETATHSNVLAWRIPGTGEPGGLLSMGSHRVGHDWSNLAAAAVYICRHYPPNSIPPSSNPPSHILDINAQSFYWCGAQSTKL